jgi:hypothetical protein
MAERQPFLNDDKKTKSFNFTIDDLNAGSGFALPFPRNNDEAEDPVKGQSIFRIKTFTYDDDGVSLILSQKYLVRKY